MLKKERPAERGGAETQTKTEEKSMVGM